MKLKILKFFALMFGMQFVMCPFDPDTKPNTPICTLSEALELANYTHEDKQSVYKKVLDHFTGANGQDFLNMQLVRIQNLPLNQEESPGITGSLLCGLVQVFLKYFGCSANKAIYLPNEVTTIIQSFLISPDPFQLPLHVYFALFTKCDFIQGKDGTIYLPTVMSDGKVHMLDSGMRFAYVIVDDEKTPRPILRPDAMMKKIIGYMYGPNKSLLAEIEIIIDENRLIQGQAKLIWKRDCCTPELIAHFNRNGNSYDIHSGRFKICSNYFNVKEFGDKSMIDRLDTLLVSEAGCQYKFPMTQILADTLLRFVAACQRALPNTVGQSFGVMYIQAFSSVIREIAVELSRYKPDIPYIALFDTRDIPSSDQPSQNT